MTSPRPKWNNPEVQAVAVLQHIDSVRGWVKETLPEDAQVSDEGMVELRALITLAVQESSDAYTAARYIENYMGWPVDARLVAILDRVYGAMPRNVDPFVHAWVMKEKVRFPAGVGDFVVFRVGRAEMQGHVSAVIQREARGIVDVKVSPTHTRHMSVDAEDVIRHRKGGTKPTDGTPTPPVGGTPVAATGGAQLREARAA